MMQQQSIEFFFPLTEQIPLDLDFTQCSPHQYWLRAQGIAGREGPFPTGTKYVIAETNITPTWQFNVDNTTVNIISKHKPNIIRRYLYKALGINWKTT